MIVEKEEIKNVFHKKRKRKKEKNEKNFLTIFFMNDGEPLYYLHENRIIRKDLYIYAIKA
jgi:hypothetical protein